MQYPTLNALSTERSMIDVFKGYNHNLRISEGEFYNMKNLTSDYYPVLSPRNKRGLYKAPEKTCSGMIAKDALCYVDGTDLYIDSYKVPDFTLSDAPDMCPKQLVSMGAYLIILPDKKYVNTIDLNDKGNIEAVFTTQADVTFELCRVTGEGYDNTVVSPSEPENPNNMDLWIDTSQTPHTLKQYSSVSSMWVSIATTYIKISSPGIGAAFQQYDGVDISGVISEALQDLNGNMIVWERGEDFLVVVGILDAVTTQRHEDGAITVSRKMPNMDFVTESGNRLWGCRYGTANNGEIVNEIYASKLGDFKNWRCYMGLSNDSYTASCGTDGPFTGAATHMGYPLFFKENVMHKVYGNFPSNYQVQSTACRGVQKGSNRSLAIVNETLYYKSQNGICAYDGSLPAEISYPLGARSYENAVGGGHDSKYYVSMQDSETGEWALFVYDAAYGTWHKEDDTRADAFCSCRNAFYYVDHISGEIRTITGGNSEECGAVEWMAETGLIGTQSPDKKYLSRMVLRMVLPPGSVVNIYAEYDTNGEWRHLLTLEGKSLRSFAVPVRPRRCDHLRLKLTGTGDAKIYSIAKTIEQGSDYD